jgi:hypothetical protein
MQRRELLVSVAQGERLRRLDKAARPLGVFLDIHRFASFSLPLSPEGTPLISLLSFRPAALISVNQPVVVALISGATQEAGETISTSAV